MIDLEFIFSHSGVEASDSPLADPKATLTQAGGGWKVLVLCTKWVMMMMMMMMMSIMTIIRMTIIKDDCDEGRDNDGDM